MNVPFVFPFLLESSAVGSLRIEHEAKALLLDSVTSTHIFISNVVVKDSEKWRMTIFPGKIYY